MPSLFRSPVRPLTILAAALVLMGQTAPRPTPSVVPAPAATETLVGATGVHPGGTLRLALRVDLPLGFHVQSNAPRDRTLIPTTLTLQPPAGLRVTEIVFPPAQDFVQEGAAEPLLVFEQTFLIGITVEVDGAQAPGVVQLPARFRYQTCDDKLCYRPVTLNLSWPVRVVPATDRIGPQHADAFARIAFGTGAPPAPIAEPPARPSAASTPSGDDTADALALLDRFDVRHSDGGYMNSRRFLEFIREAEAGIAPRGWFEDRSVLAIIAIVFVGGIALNLTPCVLPMIPINLAIIGAGTQSRRRGRGFLLGATYGAAMAVVYGVLGLLVIFTTGTFGAINASPWFNLAIAALFVVLGLAMFDIVNIDFSRLSSRIRFSEASRGTFVLAFGMGAIAALLAGACVAPVVIQVVLFASDRYAAGIASALALPFLLGLGMALPWPIAGAGLAALPRPGAWMVRVKHAFGIFILATAAYYAYTAYGIFANRWVDPASVSAAVDEKIKEGWHASLADGLRVAERDRTPVLIDLWATWCKNCLVMDRTTLADAEVVRALSGYTRIKLQAEDPELSPAREVMERARGVGLPTYVILQPK
jgi:cytochrome c biogenesis protein CcdA/DsbC/DsbD-like thiol-disulfide interchange protein